MRALTINAPVSPAPADRLGSLEKGKIANVIVTDGDLFEERTRVVHVFVDGRKVEPEAPALPRVEAADAAARRAHGNLKSRERASSKAANSTGR